VRQVFGVVVLKCFHGVLGWFGLIGLAVTWSVVVVQFGMNAPRGSPNGPQY
jgi:hypothetical protein